MRSVRDAISSLENNLAQVVIDRAGAQKQLRGDIRVGLSGRDQPRDLQLLRRQLISRGGIALTGGLAAGPQLRPRPGLPRRNGSCWKSSSAMRK
jgi:hypothetical protein